MRYVEGKKLPEWFGELYLERHRGTYTSMAKNKNYNRRSEFLLQTVEGMSLTKKLLTGAAYPKQALYADWHERHIFLKTAFPVDILFRTRRLMRSNMVRSNVRRIRILRGMRPNLRSVRRSGRIMPRPVTAWRF